MKFLVGRSSLQRPCKYLKYLSFVYYGCPSPFILYLNFFPENLKNKVKRLLISQVKIIAVVKLVKVLKFL